MNANVIKKIFEVDRADELPEGALVTGRFGIRQYSSTGLEKIRPIDDYKASRLNDITQVGNRIVLQDLKHYYELYKRFS